MNGPILAPDLWRAVTRRAGSRCECRGECGHSHRKDPGGRCKTEHDRPLPLHAAPREPVASWVAAAGLPVEALYALCPPCHTGVQARHRRARRAEPAPEPDALF